jgi:hypothetical protein
VIEVADRLDDQGVDQAADLVDGQRDHGQLCVWVRLWGVGGADRQDGESGQREGGEAVPGLPAADLVLVETDLAFRGLEPFLDRPAEPGDADQLRQGRRAWGPAAVEGQLTGGVVAADQQAVVPAVVGIGVSADLGEPGLVVKPRAFRAGAGAAALPCRGGQFSGDLVGAAAGLATVERQQMIAGDGQDVTEPQLA